MIIDHFSAAPYRPSIAGIGLCGTQNDGYDVVYTNKFTWLSPHPSHTPCPVCLDLYAMQALAELSI